MKDRIKLIRKNAKMNQEEFAEVLGLTRGFIAQVETEKSTFSDRTIKDICREFRVNEEWLRSGVGEMYKPITRNQQIMEFVNSAMEGSEDDIKNFALYLLSNFDSADWEAFARVAKKIKES